MLLICLDTMFSIFCACSMCLCCGCHGSKEKGQDLEWKSWVCCVCFGQGGSDTLITVIWVALPFFLKQS